MTKVINGYCNYTISIDGTVINTKTNITKKAWLGKNGYYHVDLYDSNKSTKIAIHRLLAIHFIPNPDNKRTVNHIDGNKQNNQLVNLEWSTCKENSQHAVDIGLTTYSHCEKEISQIDLFTGRILRDFKSLQEAETITGVARQNISKVVRGLRNKAGNFGWKYK